MIFYLSVIQSICWLFQPGIFGQGTIKTLLFFYMKSGRTDDKILKLNKEINPFN